MSSPYAEATRKRRRALILVIVGCFLVACGFALGDFAGLHRVWEITSAVGAGLIVGGMILLARGRRSRNPR